MNSRLKSWHLTTVGDVTQRVDVVNWAGWSAPDFRYVDIGSIDNSTLTIASTKTLAVADAPLRARQVIRAGDTVFSTVRTYLRNIGFVTPELDGQIASTGFAVLRPTSAVSGRFLYYYVQSPGFIRDMSAEQRGVSYPAVTSAQVRAMPIPVPPVAEQERIVATIEESFSSIDAALVSLVRAERRLQHMTATVLQAAITGQVEGSATIRDADGRPLLPRTWGWASVRDVADVQGGIIKNPKRRPRRDTAPFLRVANVGRATLNLDEVHRVEIAPGELDRYGLRYGDLLVVEGNGSADQIGRSAMWRDEVPGCVHQNRLIRVRPGPNLVPEYLALYWNAPWPARQIAALASSTSGLHTLSTRKIAAVPLAVPPVDDQRRIVLRVEEEMNRIGRLRSEITIAQRRALTLRSAVLTTAFAGGLGSGDHSTDKKGNR